MPSKRNIFRWIIISILSYLVLQTNSISAQEIIAEPEFSVQRGFYETAFDLVISAPTPETTIRYTLDGTDPRTAPGALGKKSSVTVYIDSYDFSNRDCAPGVVVRACAMKDWNSTSKVVTHTYLFINSIRDLSPDRRKPGKGWPEPAPGDFVDQSFDYGMDPTVLNDSRYRDKIESALKAIPSISLVLPLSNLFDPVTGIYVNALLHGAEWERTTSVELLNPDGTPGFQIDAGVRIRGAWGRRGTNPKHALRLFFREEYGADKLRYPLFGDEGVTRFDKLDLRCSQNYSWAFFGDSRNTELREVFSRDTQRDMRQPYTRSRFYHLYINGTYWGVYQSQERSEAAFAATYFGGDREDYDVIKTEIGDNLNVYEIEATDGTLDAYRRLWEKASAGFFNNDSYYAVQGLNPDGSRNPDLERLVDVDNLIDYMLCTFYVGDPDGPIASNGRGPNNLYAVYNTKNPQGFKFFRHDAEHSLFDLTANVVTPTNIGQEFRHFNPKWLHQRLAGHPEYCLRFADRTYKHFFNHGALTKESATARLLRRKAELDLAIIAESARWGDAKIEPPCTRDNDWLPEVNFLLNQIIPERSQIVLEQLIAEKLYPVAKPPVFNSTGGIVPKGTVLSLSAPGGAIYFTTDGTDPHIPENQNHMKTLILVSNQINKRVFVPLAKTSNNWRSDYAFDDSAWKLCSGSPGGIGFGDNPAYQKWITCDISTQMQGKNSSCYIRIPFQIWSNDLTKIKNLQTRILFDDGFHLWLNGHNIAHANSGTTFWNGTSLSPHEAVSVETFDLTNAISLLKYGNNLLAIQGMNSSVNDPGFLIAIELVGLIPSEKKELISASAQKYTTPLQIEKTTLVRARTLLNNEWSPLSEIKLNVPQGLDFLKITEIHYHPVDEDSVSGNEYEFIELKNIGTSPLNLDGISFSTGIDFAFPTGTVLPAGKFYVLASNLERFKARYGFMPDGEYAGQLDNNGEQISLQNVNNQRFSEIRYSDSYPWPNSADGSGFSLVLKSKAMFEELNHPANWCASSVFHGTPGKDDLLVSIKQEQKTELINFQLSQNYPNPFNAITTIRFSLNEKSRVNLRIFNVNGQQVALLVQRNFAPGEYSYNWNAADCATGIYFCRLETDRNIETRKLVLIK